MKHLCEGWTSARGKREGEQGLMGSAKSSPGLALLGPFISLKCVTLGVPVGGNIPLSLLNGVHTQNIQDYEKAI